MFMLHKIIAHCDGYIVILAGCWLKIIFLHNLARVLRSLIKKSCAPVFHIYNLVSMVGYFNEFTVVKSIYRNYRVITLFSPW